MPPDRNTKVLTRLLAGLLFLMVLVTWGASIFRNQGQNVADPSAATADADTYRARVLEIVETGDIELGDGLTQPYQIVTIRLLEGPFQEVTFQIDYGRRQLRPAGTRLRPGEQILVTVSQAPGQIPEAFFVDWVRTPPLGWLLAAFVALSLVISGWKGIRSLAAMAISLLIIVGFMLPRILAGGDPVLVSITGAFAILASTLYLVYGWTLKTHAPVLGTFTALIITGLLATYYINLTRLTGFGSEAAMFLSQQQATLNLRGLVLGGILIGALGVLDDLVITQASVVFELHAANPSFDLRELFRRGMRIGQDHVAATVNTLVLAYAGAARPLLLLVTQAGEDWANFVNREFVTEEIVRTLVGSLGLMSAVPLTTGPACLVALYHGRLGKFRRYLGPTTLAEGHAHHRH